MCGCARASASACAWACGRDNAPEEVEARADLRVAVRHGVLEVGREHGDPVDERGALEGVHQPVVCVDGSLCAGVVMVGGRLVSVGACTDRQPV